ncbi:MAG: ATP-binding cassette domain-containing protein [Candidatus Methanomethylicia archaeon]
MLTGEIIIKAVNLTKRFGELVAVDNVSFHIFRGECFGFLGPNGAGKTTTMKMIYCVLPLTSGTLTVAGMNVNDNAREIKRIVGVAPQENNLDSDLTVFQNLIVYARYFDIPKMEAYKRAKELLKFMQLDGRMNAKIDQLSAGMKRRLILARALINKPQILVLDEPTIGLDPQARHLIWDKIRSLRRQGVTIILTTHYMEEAAQLCDRIAIMDHGRIIEEGNPVELIEEHVGKWVLEAAYDEEAFKSLVNIFPNVQIVGSRIHVSINKSRSVFRDVLSRLSFKEVVVRDANLEDVFLKLTGRRLQE